MGRGESSPPRFHFLSVLSFFTLRFWAARSTSAYFYPNRAATNSLQKMNAQTPFVQWAETPASRRHRPPEQGQGSSRAAGLCAFSRERRAPRSRSRESRAHGEARWRSRRPWASLQDPAPPARDVSLLPSGKPAVRVTGPRREHFTGRRERRAHRERGSVDAPRNAEPEPGASPASSSRPAPGPPLRLGRHGLCRCGRAAGPGPGRSRADGPRPRPRARHAVWLGQGDWGGAALGTRRLGNASFRVPVANTRGASDGRRGPGTLALRPAASRGVSCAPPCAERGRCPSRVLCWAPGERNRLGQKPAPAAPSCCPCPPPWTRSATPVASPLSRYHLCDAAREETARGPGALPTDPSGKGDQD